MTACANSLADLAADAFTIFVWWDACGDSGTFDRGRVSEDTRVQMIHEKLRCSPCGSRHVSVRVAYTDVGGFHCRTSSCTGN
jgi:hypothetical protein